ncbi:hypothetical protein JTE90_001915 [Oedothorax gibbosus]|uniref:Uncharacterized protein n=1 Tax=Oedothorax gibbosus TaxID=931172 RepID=A0AAV6VW79_9ARAC|nr:hypothetical protein JTE90_001915 [Oedothorax gibbosus]
MHFGSNMKVFLTWSVLLLSFVGQIAAYKGYYDCSDDDCYFYDTDTDPRKPYMDLYMNVEGTINDTLSLPKAKYGLEFYHGYLEIDIEGFDLECACPLILKENKTFVTFHAYNDLIMHYTYKFPFSRGKDGRVDISCEYNFSSLLMNETNRAPMFLKVELTSLHIFNFVAYGIPLKWVYNLPEKTRNVFIEEIKTPVKKLIEDALLKALNKGLMKKYNAYQVVGMHDNSII